MLYSMPPLRKHLRFRVGSPETQMDGVVVEDLVQETFVKAIRHLSSLRSSEPAAYMSWIRKIADRVHIEQIRQMSTIRRGGKANHIQARDSVPVLLWEVVDADRSPSSHHALGEAIANLRKCIGKLPPDQKRVIEARYVDGLSHAEAAKVLGKREDALRALLFRAKRKLREHMKDSSLWFN